MLNSGKGVELHQQGRLAEAERIYQDVLRQQPDHFGRAVPSGRHRAADPTDPDLAVEVFRQRDRAEAGSRGCIQESWRRVGELPGRFPEALSDYDRAIALKPDDAGAYTNRGAALAALGRVEEALSSYGRQSRCNRISAEAHNNHGATLAALGYPEAALASCDTAIALQPDHAWAHFNRGERFARFGSVRRRIVQLRHRDRATAGSCGRT